MDKNAIAAMIESARAKLPDESQAAAILDALLAELTEPEVVARGGGNGNGPPTGP